MAGYIGAWAGRGEICSLLLSPGRSSTRPAHTSRRLSGLRSFARSPDSFHNRPLGCVATSSLATRSSFRPCPACLALFPCCPPPLLPFSRSASHPCGLARLGRLLSLVSHSMAPLLHLGLSRLMTGRLTSEGGRSSFNAPSSCLERHVVVTSAPRHVLIRRSPARVSLLVCINGRKHDRWRHLPSSFVRVCPMHPLAAIWAASRCNAARSRASADFPRHSASWRPERARPQMSKLPV